MTLPIFKILRDFTTLLPLHGGFLSGAQIWYILRKKLKAYSHV